MKYLKNSSPSWWLLCLPAALLPAAAMMKNRRSLLWKLRLPIFMAHGSWLSGTVNLLLRGTYCYIVFNRKDQTFEMYQKFDSMYGRHITGSFAIKNDPYQGYIISGSYDNGKGDWNQSYLVTRLLASGSMIWTAKDDVTDISRYKRCDEVPAEILKECKDLTEE